MFNKYIKIFILCLLIVTGCVQNKATGDRQLVILSQDEENNIGAREHPKIIKAFGGIYEDKNLQEYINNIGNRLAANSELPDIRWTFTILDSPVVNAFALPGGYIYVTRGLISLANDESEIASVIGHEIAHVTARHTAERHAKATISGLGLEILDIIIGRPIVSNLANIGMQGILSSFSRSQELEADKLGIRYIKKSNYDTEGSTRFLSRLDVLTKISNEKNSNLINSIFATHPKTLDRVQYSKTLATNLSSDVLRNKEKFLLAIDNMVYGDSSKHGVIRDNLFLHLDLNFKFEVPKDYKIDNQENAVISNNKDNTVIVIFDGLINQESISLIEIVEANIGRSRLYNYDEFLINNRVAISVEDKSLVNYNGAKYNRKVYLIAWNNKRVWRFTVLSAPNLLDNSILEAENIVMSFDSLSNYDRKIAQPSRIKIIKVLEGDTINSLSQNMAVSKNKKELFCVLNGIDCSSENASLSIGEPIKMISF
tara:strand:- start:4200 stop:5651 length:1452 start_codon:yes stop_codon:yes gene_type:complete